MKNNAKNEKCVYWNDGFFFQVNFEHSKNGTENEFFVQKLSKKNPKND